MHAGGKNRHRGSLAANQHQVAPGFLPDEWRCIIADPAKWRTSVRSVTQRSRI